MPTAMISRAITADEAADALQERLGNGYKVTRHGSGSLNVHHGPLAFATVRLGRTGDATIFHVHGGGLIVGRVVNEFGIARTVTGAIKDSFGPANAS
jgi:hypothetical protein